jgi:methylmalonyl-CoA mutase
MADRLLSEFPAISTEAWRDQVVTDLKGADFERRLVTTNLDGVRVRPFYRAEDVPQEAHPQKREGGWRFREEIREPDLETANRHLHRALDRGADDVSILSYPSGPAPQTLSDMAALMDGLWDRGAKIHWQCGPLSAHLLAMFICEARVRDVDLKSLEGSTDLDPIMDRCAGWIDADLGTWEEQTLLRIQDIADHLPKYGLLCIRGALFEKAGASIGQELGWSLALLNEYLIAVRSALDEGRLRIPGFDTVESALAEVVRRTEVRVGVGTSYFFEVAKLRALRALLSSLLASHGVRDVLPTIHATATSSNKTVYDATNNLLRGTVEAMAMAVGGADSITVAAYDQAYHTPDEFSEHLARNTHSLLASEAHIDAVADPLAGSYTVEWLTEAYADRAWAILQEIESAGGFVEVWQSGKIESELESVRQTRSQQVRTRRRVIVGTTAFGNARERRLKDVDTKPAARVVRPFKGSLADSVEVFIEAGRLESWLTDVPVPPSALDPYRVSWPYEHLRLRTERHAKTPVVRLVLFGDPKMRHARAGFCQSLLAAGGYDVVETIVKDLSEVPPTGADLCVLCSADDGYVAALEAHRPSVPLYIAGYPEADLERLKEIGVAGFLHIRQPLDEVLQQLHTHFGIHEYGPNSKEVKA